MDIQLKPCPFCGYEKPRLACRRVGANVRTGDYIQVLCSRCKARGPLVTNNYYKGIGKDSIEQAAKALWDHRAESEG